MKAPTVLAAAFLAGTGCTTVGPDHRPPQTEMPSRFFEANDLEPDIGDVALAEWWNSFDDPQLVRLVESAIARNLDLAAAAAKVREARAVERAAAAGTLPRVDAVASAARQRISENAIPLPPDAAGGSGGQPTFGLPGTEFSTFRIGFDAAWEVDLFGRSARTIEAARARTGAAEWSRRDAEVLVAAEVARAYLRYRVLQDRIALAREDERRQERLQSLVAARVRGGLTDGQELDQQRSAAAEAAAVAPGLEAEAEGQVHALALLTDRPIAELAGELQPPADRVAIPNVPPGLPSDLLRRRADIRRAERLLAAATADVGVAVADLYPRFSLTAAPALVSTALSSLLQWASRSFVAKAALDWPLFDGGSRRAYVDVADARREQALIAYRQTVIRALTDVENALSRIEADGRQIETIDQAIAAARDAEAIASTRHEGGLVTLADVLRAGERRLALQQRAADLRDAQGRDTVALFKALGGGWRTAEDGQ